MNEEIKPNRKRTRIQQKRLALRRQRRVERKNHKEILEMVNKLREQELENLPSQERVYYEKVNGKLCRVTLHIFSSFICAYFQNMIGGIYTNPNLDELYYLSFYEKSEFEFVLSFNKVMKIVKEAGITQLPLHPRYLPQKPKPKPRLIKKVQ